MRTHNEHPIVRTEDPRDEEDATAAVRPGGDGREPCPFPCSICKRKGRQ
jgi:hypothetical protein